MTDDEKREATTYRVQRAFGKKSNVCQIDKLVMGVEVDQYHVTIKMEGRATLDLWCDCPGFRRQNFPKIEHKHVKLALDYQKREHPKWAEYTIHGAGKNTEIEFLRGSA